MSGRPTSAPTPTAWSATTDAEHRPHRQGRHDVHRLLRREQLHGGPLDVHHRPDAAAHRPLQGRPARRHRSACRRRDITIAQALKPLGYATGQFGKNHLGDQDEYLPTNHGFDEFFGNLYHLNAEEEPERPYWPKDRRPEPFVQDLHRRAACSTDRSADGKIEDTGPLTASAWRRSTTRPRPPRSTSCNGRPRPNKPFFTWMNFTRMHVFTHVRDSNARPERHAGQRVRRRHVGA